MLAIQTFSLPSYTTLELPLLRSLNIPGYNMSDIVVMTMFPWTAFTSSILFIVLFAKNRVILAKFCSDLGLKVSAPTIAIAKVRALKKLKILYAESFLLILSYGLFFYGTYYVNMEDKSLGGAAMGLIPLTVWFLFLNPATIAFVFVFTYFTECLAGVFREFGQEFQEVDNKVSSAYVVCLSLIHI